MIGPGSDKKILQKYLERKKFSSCLKAAKDQSGISPGHMKISQARLASFNVKNAGFSPAQSFSLRQKSSPQCLTPGH